MPVSRLRIVHPGRRCLDFSGPGQGCRVNGMVAPDMYFGDGSDYTGTQQLGRTPGAFGTGPLNTGLGDQVLVFEQCLADPSGLTNIVCDRFGAVDVLVKLNSGH